MSKEAPTTPVQEVSGEMFQRVMTLYCLYRFCAVETDSQLEAAGTNPEALIELINQLEDVTFPPCFAPDIQKTIANAELLIAVANPEGSA